MHPSFIIFMAFSLTACAVSAANVADSDNQYRESHACSIPLCNKVLSANHGTYKPVLKLKFDSQLEQCY